jgi:hemerythrin-like domain-containing protein
MRRSDLYTTIHKAIRSMLYELGSKIQSNDFTDEVATRELLAQLQQYLGLTNDHADYEERYIHPELRLQEPDLVAELESMHREIERYADVAIGIAAEIEQLSNPDELIVTGERLHNAYNDYIAYLLSHINLEEAKSRPALWKHFTDDQLEAMRSNIMRSLTPGQSTIWIGGIFASSEVNELAQMVAMMKASPMPPEAKEAIMNLASNRAGEERWQIIQQRAENKLVTH